MTDAASTDWLLDDLVTRVPSARQAIVLSVDGLLTGKSRTLSRMDAEHLAAIAAGFAGLARTAGRHFRGGPVRHPRQARPTRPARRPACHPASARWATRAGATMAWPMRSTSTAIS